MSIKNKAGAIYYRFTSQCERSLDLISRNISPLRNDCCTKCGAEDCVLTMSEDGYYECDGCREDIRPVERNKRGRLWTF